MSRPTAVYLIGGGPLARRVPGWARACGVLPIVADREGRWKQSVAAHTLLDPDGRGAMLVALDRYLAPRVGSIADDAGGLATPRQAAEWLQFVALECPECATPVEWSEDAD